MQKFFSTRMKHFIIPFISLLSFTVAAQTKVQVVAIGSYNCENLFDTTDDPDKKDEDFTPDGSYGYTGDVYRAKLHNTATVLSRLGTDVTPDGAAVIGLVEIENNTVLEDLVSQKEIAGRHYKYCWHPTPDERGISTAMLYNPKYMTVIASEPIPVPLESLGQRRPTRAILHIYGVLAGDTVHILVNHWPSKSGGEAASAPGRMLAASVNKRFIDSLLNKNPETKVMLMGDLNDEPTSEPIISVLKAKADKSKTGQTELYNPWIRMYKKGMGTENYRGEWGLLDQIMLTGNMVHKNSGWTFHKAEIFNRDFLINHIGSYKGLPHRSFTVSHVWDNGYSDHFPVLVYLVREKK